MNTEFTGSKWRKIHTALVVAIFVTILSSPIHAESKPLNAFSSSQLYELAYNSANNKDYINASVYLFAYTQQNPPEYVNNTTYRDAIDKTLVSYFGEVGYAKEILRQVESCGRYPCNSQSSGLGSSYGKVPLPPLHVPPNAALVCPKPNYLGKCKILYVGDYLNFTQMEINDAVSSVSVGSQVKITLYLHARFDSQSITFTSDDSDLSNNRIDTQYTWSKNASAAKVQYR
jgi:hypothetical protein